MMPSYGNTSSQFPRLTIRLDLLNNYSVTGEDDKAVFSIPGDTLPSACNHSALFLLSINILLSSIRL
jgi:hypothetical protein